MIRRDVLEQATDSQQSCMHAKVSCNTSFRGVPLSWAAAAGRAGPWAGRAPSAPRHADAGASATRREMPLYLMYNMSKGWSSVVVISNPRQVSQPY